MSGANWPTLTRAGRVPMEGTVETGETVWVVLDEDDQVMVMAKGRDAAAFAAEWAERGARVVELHEGAVAAA